MDRIFIERLSLKGKHGVHDREREVEQEFLIDISAEFDTRKAAASDQIGDTLDYDRFRTAAREAVENNSFYLVERLAEEIANRVLADKRIKAVSVSIRKPTVYPDAVPGVEITRTRA